MRLPYVDSHLHSLVTASAYHLVRHKVDAVHLVGMTRQIDPDLVRLEVPELETSNRFSWRTIKQEASRVLAHLQSGILAGTDEHA
jgi:hypothetical protein